MDNENFENNLPPEAGAAEPVVSQPVEPQPVVVPVVPVAPQPVAPVKSHKLRNILISAGAVVVAAAIGVGAYLFLSKPSEPVIPTIPQNVTMGSVNLSGMTAEQAAQAIEVYMDETYGSHDMVVSLLGTPTDTTLVNATIEEIPDAMELMQAALEESAAIHRAETEENDAATEESKPEESKPSEAPSEAPTEPAEPVDPDAREDGLVVVQELVFKPGDLNLSLDVSGIINEAMAADSDAQSDSHDIDMMKYLTIDDQQIHDAVNNAESALKADFIPSKVETTKTTIQVPVKPAEPAEPAETTSEDAAESTEPTQPQMEDKTVDALAITVGQIGCDISADSIYQQIMQGYTTASFVQEVKLNFQAPDPIDLDALMEQHGKPAVNAAIDPTTFDIIPDVPGFGFDKQTVLDQITAAKPGDVLTIPITDFDAPLTAQLLNANLFNDQLGLSETRYIQDYARTTNLTLCTGFLNGAIVAPGEEFSFNRRVGERTPEKGYQKATAYGAGGTYTQEFGGGVCQVATTLYQAVLYADLEVTERHCHMFTVSYADGGLDATVYWGSLDFRFRNNTPYPIRINAGLRDGKCYIELVGTQTHDYTVELVSEPLGGLSYAAYMRKLDANGNEISYEKINNSYYSVHEEKPDPEPEPEPEDDEDEDDDYYPEDDDDDDDDSESDNEDDDDDSGNEDDDSDSDNEDDDDDGGSDEE